VDVGGCGGVNVCWAVLGGNTKHGSSLLLDWLGVSEDGVVSGDCDVTGDEVLCIVRLTVSSVAVFSLVCVSVLAWPCSSQSRRVGAHFSFMSSSRSMQVEFRSNNQMG
jgi:hypothetical protein